MGRRARNTGRIAFASGSVDIADSYRSERRVWSHRWPLVVVPALVVAAAVALWLAGPLQPDRGADEPADAAFPQREPRLVPTAGRDAASFGVHHDWGEATPTGVAARFGDTPVFFGLFVHFPFEDADYALLDRAAAELVEADAALPLTVEPHEGLDTVTDGALDELTSWLETWNSRGLPVLVRFAHEMNGGWYAWGQRPEEYVVAFRRAAEAVRAAPTSEIMWAPNEGGGYPFPGGDYNAVPGDPGFDLLDTDGDGELTQSDDPYAPYYPGDDYVDRVGLTVYHFGEAWPWGDNVVPEDGKFLDKILGTYDGTEGDQKAVPDFHAEYARDRDLPMMVAETSSLYNVDREGPDGGELAIKSAWLEQIFADDLLDELPALDALVWFAVRKPESEIDDELISWGLTHDDEILEAFHDAVPAWLRFVDGRGGPA